MARAGETTVDTSRTFVQNANAAHGYRGEPSWAEMCRTAKKKGHAMDSGHLGRVMRGENCPGLDYVAAIAAALDSRPWQLLVPGFDPANPPRVITARQAAVIDQLAAGTDSN